MVRVSVSSRKVHYKCKRKKKRVQLFQKRRPRRRLTIHGTPSLESGKKTRDPKTSTRINPKTGMESGDPTIEGLNTEV